MCLTRLKPRRRAQAAGGLSASHSVLGRGSDGEENSSAKPRPDVGTIGHVDHGKTTTTAALTKVSADKFGTNYVPYDQVATPRNRRDVATRRRS